MSGNEELNQQIEAQTQTLAEGAGQLADTLSRKAEAMHRIRQILDEPKTFTVHDLLQAAVEGGYQLKLNFHEIGG